MSDTPESFSDKEPAVDARNVHGGVETTQAPERPRHAPHHSPTLLSVKTQTESQVVEAVRADDRENDTTSGTSEKATSESAGFMILQWLTYVFWGWTAAAGIWLAFVVASHMIMGVDAYSTQTLPYVIAAVVVFAVLSLVCDAAYSRREAPKKTGMSMLLMVIHTVVFALIGVGTFLAALFMAIRIAIDGDISQADSRFVGLATFGVAAILYGLVFLRTLNLGKWLRKGRVYSVLMTLAVGGLVALAVIGPLSQSPTAREDLAVEDMAYQLTGAINEYIALNNQLPQKLGDISLRESVQKAVANNTLSYTPHDVVSSMEYSSERQGTFTDYRYELCVVFAGERKMNSTTEHSVHVAEDAYVSELSIQAHPAGKTCFKLKETISSKNGAVNVQTMKL